MRVAVVGCIVAGFVMFLGSLYWTYMMLFGASQGVSAMDVVTTGVFPMVAATVLLLGSIAGFRHVRARTRRRHSRSRLTPPSLRPSFGAALRAATKRSPPAQRQRPIVACLDNRTGVRYCHWHKEAPVTKHDAARKQRIVDYIATTVRQRGYPPSVREIAKAVDLASTSAVHHHLQALEREGLLERGASHSRAIRVTPTAALRSGMPGSLMPMMEASGRVYPDHRRDRRRRSHRGLPGRQRDAVPCRTRSSPVGTRTSFACAAIP